MYEKYNAFEVGVGGGGGEYVPQVGFGWSNGVALLLLQQAYPATNGGDSDSDSGLSDAAVIAIACAGAFVGLAIAILVLLHFVHPVPKSGGEVRDSVGVGMQGATAAVHGRHATPLV